MAGMLNNFPVQGHTVECYCVKLRLELCNNNNNNNNNNDDDNNNNNNNDNNNNKEPKMLN
eukprot:3764490-Amphidinium_carterae.1